MLIIVQLNGSQDTITLRIREKRAPRGAAQKAPFLYKMLS